MFTADEIHARVRQQPFTPLRIVTSSGQSFDVKHPDLIMVGRRSLEIGIASKAHPSIYEQVARVAIMHITALEDLPTPPSSTGNGEQELSG